MEKLKLTLQKDEKLRHQNSNQKEPEIEPAKHLEKFKKLVIKRTKEKERINNPIE